MRARNNPPKLTESQYRLWACVIVTGVHADKDAPLLSVKLLQNAKLKMITSQTFKTL